MIKNKISINDAIKLKIADNPSMSIIIVIKNRTDFKCIDNGVEYNLQLFKNNLNGLFSLLTNRDNWELVVVDFNSTDVNMSDFLQTTFTKYNNPKHFTYQLLTVNDALFNKGKGLNIGAKHAKHELLFFLDADMLLTNRQIIETAYKVTNKQVYFPVCINYENPQHTKQSPRPTGKGNVFIRKSFLTSKQWPEYKQWGLEDDHFYEYFAKHKLVYRDYPESFFHQWHPNTFEYKNKYYLINTK